MVDKRVAWILRYIEEHGPVDVLDQRFHAEYTARFGGSVDKKAWGSSPNRSAMRMLGQMYREYMVLRRVTSLGSNRQPGFPNWVYTYW